MIFSLFVNSNRFSNLKVLDIAINMETLLINTIKDNVSELVFITEVKFIKKFLHAVCENCHTCVNTIQKVLGTVSGFIQVQRERRDSTILHRQKRLLSFQMNIFCIS